MLQYKYKTLDPLCSKAGMPEDIKRLLFTRWHGSSNDSWKEYEVGSFSESKEYEYDDENDCFKEFHPLDKWFIEQGCNCWEKVLVKYWW